MKLNLYGPTDNNVSVIKTSIANMNNMSGNNIQTYTAAVNPTEAEIDDVFTIDEEWV